MEPFQGYNKFLISKLGNFSKGEVKREEKERKQSKSKKRVENRGYGGQNREMGSQKRCCHNKFGQLF